jgi:hypothetical protein
LSAFSGAENDVFTQVGNVLAHIFGVVRGDMKGIKGLMRGLVSNGEF